MLTKVLVFSRTEGASPEDGREGQPGAAAAATASDPCGTWAASSRRGADQPVVKT